MDSEQDKRKRPVTPIEEFAYLTCMSTSKARQLARDGEIATCKIGKRLLVMTDEVDRLIAQGMRPRLAENAVA